ncbi:outer membrane protein [Sphingomonas gellani]|uniref:Outer membrane protein n=1 Tax=Sphingomonas gellani TaxID=1166340 RepID=A0A1H7ZLX8_9SPHN|nr:TolC family outer membrane protein [Sphingomonas gellani]SEM58944.1 outer membrane protein [Sphingomonas gellani]
MRIGTWLAGASLLTAAAPASAETLRDALLKAYTTNPTLTGQRAGQRATDETVPLAKARGRPTAGGQAGYTENFYNTGNSFASPARQLTGGVSLSVPIYQGGQVRNSIRAAETRVSAGQAGLRNTEANLFAEVVAAFMDVIRDAAIVGLNQQNVRVLEVNLQASRDRFQVGDLTRTDVAQSDSRLAIARAQLQSAQAQLIASRENYIRVVGTPPGQLEDPPVLPQLPNEVETAVAAALRDNPALVAAARQRDATRYDVEVARSYRLPRLSGSVGSNYNSYLGSLGAGTAFAQSQSGVAATAGLSLSVPFYQGGLPGAQVRQAEALRSQAIEAVTETERSVIAAARSSFAIWRSSQEVIASSEVAVNANKLSLEGVRAENSVGTRTILDILNAEQELLNSQVTLVTARRDAYVAGFNLLAAMGGAEARDLGLDGGVLYDPTANYKRVRNKLSDWSDDGEPVAVATRTDQTPVQNAVVETPKDPLLQKPPVDTSRPLTTGADAPSRRQ